MHSSPFFRFRCWVIASSNNGGSTEIFLQTFLWQYLPGPTDQWVHSSGPLLLQFKYPANLLPGKSLKNNVNSALLNWILIFELILLSENLLITLLALKVHNLVNTLVNILLSLLSLALFLLYVCLFILPSRMYFVFSRKKCFLKERVLNI